jgi:NADPH:quinone reductase
MTGMRALRFSRYGGPEVLEVATIEVPEPAAGEVLVRVRAAGLNPVSSTPHAVAHAAESVREGGFLVSIMHDVTEEIAATADRRGVRHADILVAADGAGMRRLAGLASTGQLTVQVAGTYPLDAAADAYAQVGSRRTPGKVVLIP